MIRIVTDSTCDLPQSIIDEYNIAIVPAYVNVGEQSYVDGVTLDRDDFYTNLPVYASHPSTAAAAPGEFQAVFDRMADEGATEVLAVLISADLSAFFNAARLGADASHANVTLVDSRNTTMGLGLLVLRAAEMVADGLSVADIVTTLNDLIPRTFVYAAADTLEFLRKSGRVGFATAGIGSLLKIKPILVVTEGEATSFDRVRTSKKVIPKLAALLADKGALEDLAIVHAAAPDRAQAMHSHIASKFPSGSRKLVSQIGPTIGAHCGPGTIGLAFITKA